MQLIIQGADVDTVDLKRIAKHVGARGIEQISAFAFRLQDVREDSDASQLCEAAQLDFAFVPEARRLSQYRLLAMDMDSTLITIETIDELADLVGFKKEVAAITEAAMRGEI